MPREIEKNDVDISKLFVWYREVDLSAFGQARTVYIRLVGDSELSRARIYALRKSAEMRKKLRTPGSDENVAYIPDFEVITDPELVQGLLALSIKELASKAVSEVKIPLPIEPDSDATLEQQEAYQQEVDEYPVRREMAIREYIEKELLKEQKKWQKLDKQKLYDIYVTSAVNQLCEMEMLESFRKMCAFFGTYEDDSFENRVFSDIEEFDNLPSNVKEQLMNNYLELDIEGEVLKKLPGVTQ